MMYLIQFHLHHLTDSYSDSIMSRKTRVTASVCAHRELYEASVLLRSPEAVNELLASCNPFALAV